MANGLTKKHAKFVEVFIETGVTIEAYRAAYSCENASYGSINARAARLIRLPKISEAIEAEKERIREQNRISLDEIINELSGMVRFNPKQLHDEEGSLIPVHLLPDEVARNIKSITFNERFNKDGNVTSTRTQVTMYDKQVAADMLVKMQDGYSKKEDSKDTPRPILEHGKQLPE